MTRDEQDLFNGRAQRLEEYRVLIAALEAELATERARLDWLESKGFSTHRLEGEREMGVHSWGEPKRWTAHYISSEYGTARAAIDAAMEGSSAK